MNASRPISVSSAAKLALAVAAAAAVTGAVFASWAQNGSAMFASMIEAGLALCF